tara:strand:- start:308 stop:469 length:162 start_codon:yes stop_codon:yes gene_type:complete
MPKWTAKNFYISEDGKSVNELIQEYCECVELEWSPIPNPACPVHGDGEDEDEE